MLAIWIIYANASPNLQKSPSLNMPLQFVKNPSVEQENFIFEKEAFFYDKPVTKSQTNPKFHRKDIYGAVLKGTVLVHPKENNLAFVVEPGEHESRLVRVGDIFLGAKVMSIDQNKMILMLDQVEISLSVFSENIDKLLLHKNNETFLDNIPVGASNTETKLQDVTFSSNVL